MPSVCERCLEELESCDHSQCPGIWNDDTTCDPGCGTCMDIQKQFEKEIE